MFLGREFSERATQKHSLLNLHHRVQMSEDLDIWTGNLTRRLHDTNDFERQFRTISAQDKRFPYSKFNRNRSKIMYLGIQFLRKLVGSSYRSRAPIFIKKRTVDCAQQKPLCEYATSCFHSKLFLLLRLWSRFLWVVQIDKWIVVVVQWRYYGR